MGLYKEELTPSYKTIANFRKDNPKALQIIFKEFTLLIKDLQLITGDLVAVDGAFLRANASKNTLIMKRTIEDDIKKAEAATQEYLTTLEYSDEETVTNKLSKNLPNNLEKLLKKKQSLNLT